MSDNGFSIGSASRAVERPANVASGRPLSAPARPQAPDGTQAQTSNADTRIAAASPPSASQPGVPVEALRAATSPGGQAFSEQAQFFAEQGVLPRRRGEARSPSERTAVERTSRAVGEAGGAASADAASPSVAGSIGLARPSEQAPQSRTQQQQAQLEPAPSAAGASAVAGARPFRLPEGLAATVLASGGQAPLSFGQEDVVGAENALSAGLSLPVSAGLGFEGEGGSAASPSVPQVAVGFGRAALLSGEITITLAEARVDNTPQTAGFAGANARFNVNSGTNFGANLGGDFGADFSPRGVFSEAGGFAPEGDFVSGVPLDGRADDFFADDAVGQAAREEAGLVAERVGAIGQTLANALERAGGEGADLRGFDVDTDVGEVRAGTFEDALETAATTSGTASAGEQGEEDGFNASRLADALRAGEAVSRRVLQEQAPTSSTQATGAAFSDSLPLGFVSEAIRQYQAVIARAGGAAFS